ncbi:hypothetical protein VFPPC_03337 [Pochonia chlamydosporia 170]|uniref:Uncharacterized protein n=1 Tax=Pochonia chlamydosporia 170 TaxID=1380566 RepID=A0A179FZ85_METCM|nr:hypothetical protein VFPPC_03337 [Pochonia chlamydosporia 170]OAQ70954.1 hypothetical protein VFPPC_03337 [Pochonia chlamydosporia 170]
MANYMQKYGLILLLFITGVWAVAVTIPSNEVGLDKFPGMESLPVIKYDGPRYELTEEDKAELLHAHSTGGPWKMPAGMPHIELQAGNILDLGVDTNLTKRAGNRVIGAFGGYNCPIETIIASVVNFGCGTGCITVNSNALSGLVIQQIHGNPYPTMDVWASPRCQGDRLQHFGVDDRASCTNVNNCCGFRSFIGYWNC